MQGWMVNKWTMGMNGDDYIMEENLHKYGIGKILEREIKQDLL